LLKGVEETMVIKIQDGFADVSSEEDFLLALLVVEEMFVQY
jgi:hypothetical protein